MKKKIQSLWIMLAVMLLLVSCTTKEQQSSSSEPDKDIGDEIVAEVEISLPEQIKRDTPLLIQQAKQELIEQNKIEADLLAELNSGTYSFESPFEIVNPYGTSPLSALLLFQTEQPTNISIFVQGSDDLTNIEFTFDGYQTQHMIPVYGLYPEQENKVVLTARTQSGESKTKEILLQTEALPPTIAGNILIPYLPQPEKYQPGFNFSYFSGNNNATKSSFDANGDYRWVSTEQTNLPASFFVNDSEIIIPTGYMHEGPAIIKEINLLGKIKKLYYSPYGVHHDIEVCDDDTMIITGSFNPITGTTIEDMIYRIDLKTGAITQTLSYLGVLPRSRQTNSWYLYEDWLHMNSIIEIEDDVIISSNVQCAVVRNSWDGTVKWVLTDPKETTSFFNDKLLTPIGAGFEYPYNQHAVELLPDYDNNPDTIDIILFDNGSTRFQHDSEMQKKVELGEAIRELLYSRMVHYRINEKEMTVEQIRQYGKERPEIYSTFRGDADLLPNNNWLGTFLRGDNPPIEKFENIYSTVYVEVDENNEVVWECLGESIEQGGTYTEYRTERLPLYAKHANNLQIGVPAGDFLPSTSPEMEVKE